MGHWMKNIEPNMSLQNVMNMIQLRFMAEQAQQIGEHLASLIKNTLEKAPVRKKGASGFVWGFFIDRNA